MSKWALLLSVLSLAAGYEVKLTKLSTIYVPHDFDDNNQPQFQLLVGSVEQLAYEPTGKLIYGVGDGIFHVIDASNPANMVYLNGTVLPELDLTDVEACGGHVFVSYVNKSDPLNGGVRVYGAYSKDDGSLELLHDIPMGALPDMVYPTPDCTIVVAIENEGLEVNGQFYDPPGGVGIIRFPQGVRNLPTVINLDFTKFDDQFDALSQSGVRWVYRGNGTSNPFSNNAEPEYVTFNTDYTKAYIGLQENNAVAEVDLATNTITSVRGLGFKQWGELDPSDRDGGINIADWPVYGMYLPDTIHFVRWSDEDYILTANEGDAQEYKLVDFSEEQRGKHFPDDVIAPSVDSTLRQALKDDAKLGRLTFSSVDGKNSDGLFEKFYTYGGRSFSVFRVSDMQRVYDSGSDMEKKTAQLRPDLFNNNIDENDKIADGVDTRSDNKGPETESLTVGEVGGRLLIFVGNERPGSLFVYSVGQGGMEPRFETMVTGIPTDTTRTWQQMFDDKDVYGLDLEYLGLIVPQQKHGTYRFCCSDLAFM
nr:hypothetical protein BaRGS_021873 [Batillaria attramentaria]